MSTFIFIEESSSFRLYPRLPDVGQGVAKTGPEERSVAVRHRTGELRPTRLRSSVHSRQVEGGRLAVEAPAPGKTLSQGLSVLACIICRKASHLLGACVAMAVLWQATLSGALAQTCADVALVLAVDGSSSIDAQEYRFQQQAIAASLRDPGVLNAIASAGTVSTAVVFWGDPDRPVQETETTVVDSALDADRIARVVESLPRQVLGNTGLSTGLAAALGKLRTMGCAHRSIINVSGDGKGTILSRRKIRSPRLEEVRAMAASEGVTINALVVSNEEPDLADYYQNKVITGPGAFVMEVRSYADYAEALRRKLIREITPQIIGLAD